MTEITDAEARAMALQGIVEIARGVDIAISEIRSGKFMDAQGSLLLAKAGAVVAEAAVQKIRTPAALIAEAVDQARAEERERIAAAIESGYLGPDFGRQYDGRESPDARLHDAYDEGLESAARIARSQP